MRDDASRDVYLWDGSGEPDPEVVRLERLLGPYAHRGTAPSLPARAPGRRVLQAMVPILTAAASLALVAATAWFASARHGVGWTVESLEGAPAIGGAAIAGEARLGVGQALTTDAFSRARIAVGEIGRVDIEPNSRVRLLQARRGEHRMALDVGRIRAEIWAPPGRFFVNTPSATAVDLGCAYTLDVDGRGWGTVRVTLGWVAFEYRGRESFIPKDAVCATRPRVGPGTPRYADTSPAFASALDVLDFSPLGDTRRPPALDTVLAEARRRDALTLWHLLSRGSALERGRAYERMAALVPPPPQATRDAIVRGDRAALDAWWNELGLDNASWWRIWKRPWQ